MTTRSTIVTRWLSLITETLHYRIAGVIAWAIAGLVLAGVFRLEASEPLPVEHSVVAGAWLLALLVRLRQLHVDASSQEPEDTAAKLQSKVAEIAPKDEAVARDPVREPTLSTYTKVETGWLLMAGIYAAVQAMGSWPSATGLLPCLAALLFGFLYSTVPAFFAFGSLLALDSALYMLHDAIALNIDYSMHAMWLVGFFALGRLFHKWSQRNTHAVHNLQRRRTALDARKAANQARMLREATKRKTQPAQQIAEAKERSSLKEVHKALAFHLDLLKRSLDLHTCALLFLDEPAEKLRIIELISSSSDLRDGPLPAGEGAVGAVAKTGNQTQLQGLRPSYNGLVYYKDHSDPVQTFIGIPVKEGQKFNGVLCADRIENKPFTNREEEIFSIAIQAILRVIDTELIFAELERTKSEQQQLFRASKALGAALNEQDVLDAGLSAAKDIAAFDFAAITHYDSERKRHSVRKAVGEGNEVLHDLSFRDNTSLTSMAVQNKHYLPYRGDFDASQHVVFTRPLSLPEANSLLVLPLIVREKAIGTLMVATQRPNAFGETVRHTLQVLCNQIAVSLANAESVRRLEELATIDALTGCLNKRAFMDEFQRKLRASERFQRSLALVIVDLDHFKGVNDTYGHATGDRVLKELGHILTGLKRQTDVVGRFGGEEFCLLCEETDLEGAQLLAERVREEVAATVLRTERGRLRVTCSLGIATFPDDADDVDNLFELADKALYVAKDTGRNRVELARDLRTKTFKKPSIEPSPSSTDGHLQEFDQDSGSSKQASTISNSA